MVKDDQEQLGAAEELVAETEQEQEKDSIRISSEVIAIIVGIVSSDIPGIAGMSGGLVGGIAEKLGKKDLTKGIKVSVEDDQVTIGMNVIAEYGISIIGAAKDLKKAIRSNVEETTGLKVKAINVNVLGIIIPEEEEEKEDFEE